MMAERAGLRKRIYAKEHPRRVVEGVNGTSDSGHRKGTVRMDACRKGAWRDTAQPLIR